jgi:hypothetical protein
LNFVRCETVPLCIILAPGLQISLLLSRSLEKAASKGLRLSINTSAILPGMEIEEGIEAMSRILHEERQRPTAGYKQRPEFEVGETGKRTFTLTTAVTGLALQVNLAQERKKRPRRVQQDTDIYEFGGANYELLLRLFGEIRESDRARFIEEMLKFVRNGGYRTKVATELHFPTFNTFISDTPLIAEFCIRMGHFKELLEAAATVKFPTDALVIMLMQIEETVALNFDLFTKEKLKHIQLLLKPIREMADLQKHGSRHSASGKTVDNPHYKPGREYQANELVKAIDGITNECDQAIFFYIKGALEKTRNPEVEGDRVDVVAFLDTLGFSPILKEALEEGEKQYRDDATTFELKSCFGHLRSFLEIMHRDSAKAIASKAKESPGRKWGEWLAYLRDKGIFTPQHDAFISSVYTLMSDTCVHPLTADREYARLMRNVVIEYGVMFSASSIRMGLRSARSRR